MLKFKPFQVSLEQDGRVLLKFCIANGFRNIQNLVQKMKRNTNIYLIFRLVSFLSYLNLYVH